jgi:hypothetical protein
MRPTTKSSKWDVTRYKHLLDPAMSMSPPPNPAPNPQRTFFSSAFSGEFFDQLRLVLDEHAQTLRGQEALFTRFATPIAALTATLERLVDGMQGQRSTPPPNGAQREPPPIPQKPPSEVPPVSPYRSSQQFPPPQPSAHPHLRSDSLYLCHSRHSSNWRKRIWNQALPVPWQRWRKCYRMAPSSGKVL